MKRNPRAREIGQKVHDYETASRFLGEKDEKKLAYNTLIYRGAEDSIAIRFHGTTIVRYYPDGRVQLDSGGWRTVTTKQRINQLLPGMMGLYQERHEWFVSNRYLGTEEPFEDGMVVQLGAPMRADRGEEPASNPGKFDNDLDHAMYLLSLDGTDEECGDSTVDRWYGLMTNVTEDDTGTLSPGAKQVMRRDSMKYPLHCIVSEDTQGFVSVDYFDSAKEAEEEWSDIESECAYEDADDGEE